MTDIKTITLTATYREIEAKYEGIPILMRHYFAGDAVHIRVNDNFARANGYNSMEDIYKIDPVMQSVQWVDADMFGKGMIAAPVHDVQERQNIN